MNDLEYLTALLDTTSTTSEVDAIYHPHQNPDYWRENTTYSGDRPRQQGFSGRDIKARRARKMDCGN